MTNAVDERGAEARGKFQVLLTASPLSSPIVFASNIVALSSAFDWGRRSKASFAVVQWVIARTAYPRQRARDPPMRGGSRKDAA